VSERKTWERMLAGAHVIRFAEFERVMVAFGFVHKRTSGSHRIYAHPSVPRPLSVQPRGRDAKPYQMRQFMQAVEEFGLKIEGEE
jgi:predicted RNA binding protein YcfA (HicA-like mRNA interferase family)